MNNSTKIGLVGGTIAFMVLLVWLFSGEGATSGKKSRKPFVSSNWTKKYQVDDKKPLGLYLFTSLAKAHIDTSKRIEVINNDYVLDSITEDRTSTKTYLFVGNDFGMNNHEMDSILSDVERGSVLFLSFDDLTENLYPRLFRYHSFRQEYSETVNVFMDGKKHPMVNIFQNDTIATEWWAFDELEFEDDFIGLSSFMELTNFVKVKHGNGFVFLHATPNLFFNYQVKRRPGYEYTARVLNELPKDNDIYLLELARLSDNYGNEDTFDQEGEEGKKEDSYLQLIFRNPTLLTAMLLSILGLILFVVFRSKRTRPVVPFIEKKKDMTMAFAETITSIYFSKRNPYGLLQVQRKNFYDTVHRFFFVDLYRREGDREIQVLAEKSNRSVEEITHLINSFETKEAAGVTEQFVADLAKKKHQFYRSVGIISDAMNEKVQSQEMIFRRSLLLPSILILAGLAFIFVGMYFLVSGIGIGIAGWPVGIVFLAQGILRLSRPCLIVTGDTIAHFNALARKREYKREDLIRTEARSSGVIFHFRNNQKLIINYWDLSRFDRKQFERLVSKLHTLEL